MNKDKAAFLPSARKKEEKGFTLIEVIIALVLLMVAVLGIFAAFTFATTFNAGNSRRSQALSVLQEEVEILRSAKFTRDKTDNYAIASPDNGRRDLTGGTKPTRTVTSKGDSASYSVQTIIDNDPFTDGIQDEIQKPKTTLKEITVIVTPLAVSGSWLTAFPTKFVFRRVRAN
jgi:Tfp pilus assembly protein PilV